MTSGPTPPDPPPDPDGRSGERSVEAGDTTGGGDGGPVRRFGRARTPTIVLATLVVTAVVAAASILIYRATGDGDGDGDSLRSGATPAAELRPADGGDAGDAGDAPAAGSGTQGPDDGAPDEADVPAPDDPSDASGDSLGGSDGAPGDKAEVAAPDGPQDEAQGESRDGLDGAPGEDVETAANGSRDAGDGGSGDGDVSGAAAVGPEDCVILVTFDHHVVLVCERSGPGGLDPGGDGAPGESADAEGSTADGSGLAGPSAMDAFADFFGPDGWDLETWEELFGPDGFGPEDGRIGWCEFREPETAESGVERFEIRCRPSMDDGGQDRESPGPPPTDGVPGGEDLPGDFPDDPVAALAESIRQALAEACREGVNESAEGFELLQQACSELLDGIDEDGSGTAAADGSAGTGPAESPESAESPDPAGPEAAAPGSESLLGSLLGDLFSGGDGEEAGGLADLLGSLLSGDEGGESAGLGGLLGDLLGSDGSADGLGGGAAGDLLEALVPGLGPLISLAQLLGLFDAG